MALDLGTPEGIAILIAILALSVCICAWCKSCLLEVLERCGSYFESVYFDWEERREEKKREQLEAREKRIEELKRQRSENDLRSKDLERQGDVRQGDFRQSDVRQSDVRQSTSKVEHTSSKCTSKCTSRCNGLCDSLCHTLAGMCQVLGQKLKNTGRTIGQKTRELYERCKRTPPVSPPPIPPRPRHRPKLSRFFTRKPQATLPTSTQNTRVNRGSSRVKDMVKTMERRSSTERSN